MKFICLFIGIIAVCADLSYEETDFADLVESDIVRMKYSLHDTYLKDDGDNTVSASATFANSDYFLWTVSSSEHGTEFRNIGSGKYLKTNAAGYCFTGQITGEGMAAAWNKESTNKFISVNDNANGCCSVNSTNDDDIKYSTCNNDNQNVVFERRVSNVYFLVNMKKSATEAALHCEALGATLATITSAADNENVFDVCSAQTGKTCWIGLNDITNEASLQWRDGTTYSYTHFFPNIVNDDEHNCVQIAGTASRYSDRYWRYRPCSVEMPFICIGQTVKMLVEDCV